MATTGTPQDDLQDDDIEQDISDLPLPDDADIEVEVDDTPEPDEVPDVEDEAAEAAEVTETVEAAANEDPADQAPLADEELEEADRAYPEPIKRRIKREIRIRKAAEANFEQAKGVAQQIAAIAQQREDDGKAKDVEIAQFKRSNATIQKQYADALDFAYDQSIQIKAGGLRKARDEGDYDAELKLQGELDGLRFQQNQVKEAKRKLPDPNTIAIPKAQVAPAAPAQAQAQADPANVRVALAQGKPPSPLAVKWLDGNKLWFNSPKFSSHRAFVLAEDSKLVREGYDPGGAEYYKELDKRVDGAFPTLRKKPAAPVGSPVAPAASGGAPPRSSSKHVIRLGRSDIANMQRFGLDPSNKAHLRQYALSKGA